MQSLVLVCRKSIEDPDDVASMSQKSDVCKKSFQKCESASTRRAATFKNLGGDIFARSHRTYDSTKRFIELTTSHLINQTSRYSDILKSSINTDFTIQLYLTFTQCYLRLLYSNEYNLIFSVATGNYDTTNAYLCSAVAW